MNKDFDQRRYPRAGAEVEVRYAPSLDSKPALPARSYDISASGMSFVTPERLPENSRIALEVHLKNLNRAIKTEGTVIRSWEENGQFIAAVEFANIEYNDFILLLDYSLAFYHPQKTP